MHCFNSLSLKFRVKVHSSNNYISMKCVRVCCCADRAKQPVASCFYGHTATHTHTQFNPNSDHRLRPPWIRMVSQTTHTQMHTLITPGLLMRRRRGTRMSAEAASTASTSSTAEGYVCELGALELPQLQPLRALKANNKLLVIPLRSELC